LFLNITGYNVLSLRLPTAIFVLLTILLIVRFSKRELGKSLVGYFGGLVLVSCTGYISLHIARTGDHDAPLAFFTSLTLLNLYSYLKHDNNKRYLFYTTLAIIAATLTKTVAGLMFLPAMVFYAAYRKKVRYIITSLSFYINLLFFSVIITGYFLLMEHLSPGYFGSVWENDMGGRYTGIIDQHRQPFLFYFNNIIELRFVPWIFLLPLAYFLVFRGKNEELKRFFIFIAICILSYWLIISCSSTKLLWYDAPLFPLMSLIAGTGIYIIFHHLVESDTFRHRLNKMILLTLFVFALFFAPYMTVIKSVYHYKNTWRDEQFGDFIKKIDPEIKQYTIILKNWNSHAVFYKEIMNAKGYKINIKRFEEVFTPGEILMTCNSLDWSKKRFSFEVLDKYRDCRLIRVKEILSNNINTN
jgi:4-amino-4-deoxy-L-arabinose transferase-like glycosyltransferase